MAKNLEVDVAHDNRGRSSSFTMNTFLNGSNNTTLTIKSSPPKTAAVATRPRYARESGDLDDLDQELDESGWKQAGPEAGPEAGPAL